MRGGLRRALVMPTGARRHLAPGLDLDDFFTTLRQRNVSYVVLRWFDTLPAVAPGEDVDLLVADEDLPVVHALMSSRPTFRRTQKFDVYSVSGLPGSDFKGVPYYAPRFAADLLERSEWLRDRYRVPSPRDHYDSLAYHAVYHKGYASGLSGDATAAGRVLQAADHDYEAVLTQLGSCLGRTGRPTLEDLDGYLAERGLRPPLDTLERLAPSNPWLSDRFLACREQVDPVWRGLAVFVLRERARSQVDLAVAELDRQGFEVLDVIELDAGQRDSARHRLRGGNWAQGPWPLSGGPPSTYLVAYDIAPDLSGLNGDNRRIARAKERLRARLLEGVPVEERYNPVHSSDNAGQALDYLEALDDRQVEHRLRGLAQRLVGSCAFPYPVVHDLSGQARRARVAIVEHPVHGQSVCKVFRPGAARFFERELRARKDLSDLPEVPGLIEHGDCWLISPLYTDTRAHVRRPLPGHVDVQLTPATSHALTRLALALHERGLFLLDLSTRNLLSDPVAGLKVLDFEFLQEYTGAAPPPRDCYTFWGVPDDVPGYEGPLLRPAGHPRGPADPASRPNSAFHPAATGSSVRALLLPARPLDTPRRAAVQLGWYLLFLLQEQARTVRRGISRSSLMRDVRTTRRIVSRSVRRR